MPRHNAPRVCGHPGCWQDLPCPDHTRTPWANKHERRANTLQGSAAQRRNRQILHRDAHTCQACHGTRCGNQNLQVDHIIPVAQGGSDHPANLQTLGAKPCHAEKTQGEALAARRRAAGTEPLKPFREGE